MRLSLVMAIFLSLLSWPAMSQDISIFKEDIDKLVSQSKLDSARIYISQMLIQSDDKETELALNYELTKVLFMQSSYDKALKLSFQSLDRISNRQEKVKFNFITGCIYSAISDYGQSVKYFNQVTENSLDSSLLCQTYLLLSNLHAEQGNEDKSAQSITNAYEITKLTKLDPRVVNHVTKQYNYYNGNFELCKAENFEVINDSASFSNAKSFAYQMIGDCLVKQDSLKKSVKYYDHSFILTCETKDPEQIKVATQKLIDVYEKLDLQAKANSYHKIYNELLKDSFSFSAEKYRELYEVEKNRELDSMRSSSSRLIIGIICLALLAALLVVYFVRKREKISDKNNGKIENLQTKKIVISPHEIQKIESAIYKLEQEELFLESNITRNSFCAKNQIKSERYLSHIINKKYNRSFSVFLNELRIKYAHKRILEDQVFRNYMIEEIAKECGFGSKKSFERVFLAHFGETPFKFISSLKP